MVLAFLCDRERDSKAGFSTLICGTDLEKCDLGKQNCGSGNCVDFGGERQLVDSGKL